MKLFVDKRAATRLARAITQRIQAHRRLYSTPVRGILWEEVLHRALGSLGVETDWRPDGSHERGRDMTLTRTGERISCKSGTIFRNGKLTFSGSRLGSCKTLADKVATIADKKEDSYALLSRAHGDSVGQSYWLIMFNTNILTYDKLSWSAKGKTDVGVGHNITCKIARSMSSQLWTTINNWAEHPGITYRKIT